MISKAQIFILFSILGCTWASLSGPYLMWGQKNLNDLEARGLVEVSEQKLASIFKDTKAVVIFLRNNTNRLDAENYPEFQKIIQNSNWSYLPQQMLAADPLNYNANVEVIPLSGLATLEDDELVSGFKDAVTIYGEGEVLGILAGREEDGHYLSKRETKDGEDDFKTTTLQPPTAEPKKNGSFIFVAGDKKAVLYANKTLLLNITNVKETIKLDDPQKAITFDDQWQKGYARFVIIFNVEREKLFLRFKFSLLRATWTIKSVEVVYKDYKNILRAVGNEYTLPSAPLRFSYRCSSSKLIFRDGNDSLVIDDYQVQPWLNGSSRFGDVYDCVGFTTTPIWSGVLVSFFLLGILSIGILALMDIKTPNRFESSRSKQLTFTVQE